VRVVGIGGGHGLAATLRAARLYSEEIAAVVTVADDGGSSGRLTRELGIPPPGDIRNCLVALSDDEALGVLWQHRFGAGTLTGHTVGNLVIAGLAEMTGDFCAAVDEAGRMLRAEGRVHPATTALVDLVARVKDGVVEGQAAVGQTSAPIESVFLRPPDPPANRDAVAAILEADQVVLGPGSLFTSLIATLLVPGIRTAVRETPARRIFVCNSRMQKGETDALDASAHLGALLGHVGDAVDAVVVQSPVLADDGVVFDAPALASMGMEVVEADVTAPDGGHDPQRLAEVLAAIGRGRSSAAS
jgi:uncharacterized cofD-like protein